MLLGGYNGEGNLGLGDIGAGTNRLVPTQLFAPEGFKFTDVTSSPTSYHAVAHLVAVPEPVCLGLLAMGGIAMLRRWR